MASRVGCVEAGLHRLWHVCVFHSERGSVSVEGAGIKHTSHRRLGLHDPHALKASAVGVLELASNEGWHQGWAGTAVDGLVHACCTPVLPMHCVALHRIASPSLALWAPTTCASACHPLCLQARQGMWK